MAFIDSQVSDPALVRFFITFQMFSWIGLSIVLMTVWLSPNIRRHPTWHNFCFSWLLYGLSYSIVTFAGQQFSPRIDFGLCMVQSTLIYAAPTLTAGTTLAFVINLWFNLKSMLSKETPRTTQRRGIVLLIFPYVLCIMMLLFSLGNAASNLDTIRRSVTGAYCVIGTNIPGDITSVWVALALTVSIGLEGVIAKTLYRDWKAFRGLGPRSTTTLGMIIRTCAFSLFGMLGLMVSLVMFIADTNTTLLKLNPYRTVPDVFIALIPALSLLLFGTQTDIISAWMFWKGSGNNIVSVEVHTVIYEEKHGP